MSQEEEKLNTECTCLASDNGYFCEGCKNSLWNIAYRSGKLAGFEMCEKLSKPFIQTLFNETENSSTKGLIMLGNCAKQTLSLIEEEKKKLC